MVGISKVNAQAIVAEIGPDMGRAPHLTERVACPLELVERTSCRIRSVDRARQAKRTQTQRGRGRYKALGGLGGTAQAMLLEHTGDVKSS